VCDGDDVIWEETTEVDEEEIKEADEDETKHDKANRMR
jgi:hypothetical protein